MTEAELLQILQLKRTWLDDIVDVFLKRPNGVAEVDAVVEALLKSDRDMGAEGESTVTRTINNFCINTGDSDTKERHPVFERIGPSKYRLLTYPAAPDLLEIQKAEFVHDSDQGHWKWFVARVKKNPKWGTMSKRERLVAFAKWLKQVKNNEAGKNNAADSEQA